MTYQNQYSQAIQAYTQALEIDPNNIEALSGLDGYIADLDPLRGLAMAKKAWELDPLSEATRVGLINLTTNADDYEGAESLIRMMLLDDPENPGLYEAWAALYGRQGLIHLAIPKMEMVHRLRPGDVWPARSI